MHKEVSWEKAAMMKSLPEKIQEVGAGKIKFRWTDGAFLADDALNTTKLSGTLLLQAIWSKAVITYGGV